MVSTLKVNTIQRQSGTTITIGESGDTITITAGASLTGPVAAAGLTGSLPAISGASITNLDAANISTNKVPTARLGSGTASATTYLAGDQTYKALSEYDDNQIQSNIAILGFKVAVNGSLSKYNLVDQVIDEYEDSTGIDLGSSTNESLDNGAWRGVVQTGENATGGTITTYTDGDTYKVHTFTSSGDFVTGTGTMKGILMIGGGGGGAGRHGGGGGGGEVLYGTSDFTLQGDTYAVVIGSGGNGGGTSWDGKAAKNGVATTFNGVSSDGGGGGGNYEATGAKRGQAGNGGSGGGAGGGSNEPSVDVTRALSTAEDITTPFAATAYGNIGGLWGGSDLHDGGGGGGANGTGGDAASALSGVGGAGKQISDFNETYYWAGGGGGNGWQSDAADGGIGGGGGGSANGSGSPSSGAGGGSALNSGGDGTDDGVAGSGGANTGGGGGGGNSTSGGVGQSGGAGGSGIFKIKYVEDSLAGTTPLDLTLQSTANTAQSTATKSNLVMLIENVAGTATLNTDIKGFVSANGGSNFTEGTLVDEGTWGTNKVVVAFHDLTLSHSGTDMRYKITTHNQSVSKDTRIHATSIGWS